MLALGKIEGKEFQDIVKVCEQKRIKRGAFEQRIYLERVE